MARLTNRGFTTEDAAEMERRCQQTHTVQWKANVRRGTTLLAEDIPLVGGRLILDSSDPIRRHLQLEVGGDEEWVPRTPSSPLVPFGQRITLWVRIDRADGSWLPWLKMGEYQIFTHSFERPSMITVIECHDMAGAVDEYLTLGKRSFVGQTVHDAVKDLCEEAVPGYIFAVHSSDAAKDPDRAIRNYVADAGTSRWEAATEVARRRGHECFFNADGDLVIRHDVTDDNDTAIPGVGPDIGTVANPVATIKDGAGGNLVGLTATVSREGACNGVRINLHSTVPRKVRKKADREALGPDWETAPIFKGVTERQEAGPVAWGGLFGRIPIVIERNIKDLKKWSNGGEESWSDAQVDAHQDAKRILHRRRGLTRYLDIHAIPQYWLEADDKVRVRWHENDGTAVTEAHFVQRVEFDLAGGGPMVVRTRQLNVVDPGVL
jgi:hypothetical protein